MKTTKAAGYDEETWNPYGSRDYARETPVDKIGFIKDSIYMIMILINIINKILKDYRREQLWNIQNHPTEEDCIKGKIKEPRKELRINRKIIPKAFISNSRSHCKQLSLYPGALNFRFLSTCSFDSFFPLNIT